MDHIVCDGTSCVYKTSSDYSTYVGSRQFVVNGEDKPTIKDFCNKCEPYIPHECMVCGKQMYDRWLYVVRDDSYLRVCRMCLEMETLYAEVKDNVCDLALFKQYGIEDFSSFKTALYTRNEQQITYCQTVQDSLGRIVDSLLMEKQKTVTAIKRSQITMWFPDASEDIINIIIKETVGFDATNTLLDFILEFIITHMNPSDCKSLLSRVAMSMPPKNEYWTQPVWLIERKHKKILTWWPDMNNESSIAVLATQKITDDMTLLDFFLNIIQEKKSTMWSSGFL